MTDQRTNLAGDGVAEGLPEAGHNVPPAVWRHPAVIVATGFWLGRSPVAPGTCGALLGLPLAWAIGLVPSVWVQAGLIICLGVACVPLCGVAARRLGGQKDPPAIVIDEITSLPITFFLVSAELVQKPLVLVIGFALHRLFDITKPPPARQLERLPEGLGIMADDWAAAVYSCVALHVVLWTGWL
jgi:phosphatidylglycerophosphatase A